MIWLNILIGEQLTCISVVKMVFGEGLGPKS